MKKKILSIILGATVLFGAFSFSACSNSELEAELADLQTQITELKDQKDELQASVTEKQAQIAELVQENQRLQNQIDQYYELLTSNIFEREVNDMVDCSKFLYSAAMSSIGEKIYLNYEDDNAVFECSVDQGSFELVSNDSQCIKNKTVKANDGIYWHPEEPDIEPQTAFIDIVLKLDENIIGYAVLEVKTVSPNDRTYSATVLKSAIFPKLNGEYQNVTKEYVDFFIEVAKSKPVHNTNEDFADDCVIVVLTKTATRQFLDYTKEDFKEVNATAVYDLTAATVDWVEKQILGIPTEETMLINVEKFRRILKIELAQKGKKEVLNAVSILEQREDIESASPNYIIKLDPVIPVKS